MDTTPTPTTAAAGTLAEVRDILVETLDIPERAAVIEESTSLLGSLPELDSLAVVQLMTAVEERFGFSVDDADVTADVFETLGTLAAFVDANRG